VRPGSWEAGKLGGRQAGRLGSCEAGRLGSKGRAHSAEGKAVKAGRPESRKARRLEGQSNGDALLIVYSPKVKAMDIEQSLLNSEVGMRPSTSSDETKSERYSNMHRLWGELASQIRKGAL